MFLHKNSFELNTHFFFPVLKIMPATYGNFLTHHGLRLVEVVTENAMALTYIKCGSTTYIIFRTTKESNKVMWALFFTEKGPNLHSGVSPVTNCDIYRIPFIFKLFCKTSMILKYDNTFIKLSFSLWSTPQNTYTCKAKWHHSATIWKQKRSKNIWIFVNISVLVKGSWFYSSND